MSTDHLGQIKMGKKKHDSFHFVPQIKKTQKMTCAYL